MDAKSYITLGPVLFYELQRQNHFFENTHIFSGSPSRQTKELQV
jgi:hypothetical protein